MVILKNCETELSYILAELFNVSEGILFSRLLQGLVSGTCIRNVTERCTTKKYRLVSLLSVRKIFEKLVNNRLVDHLEKCGEISSMAFGLLCQLQIF